MVWPVIITRAYVADKVTHGFFVGFGIASAMTVVNFAKYSVAQVGAWIDWRGIMEKARQNPSLIFDNPKRIR